MKLSGKLRSDSKAIALAYFWLIGFTCLWVAVLVAFGGCAPTIAPKAAHDSAPTYDGTQRNSGFLGFDSHGNGIITPRAFQRYQGLLSEYRAAFTPALGTNDWPIATATNTYVITPQELTYFATMSRWKKGRK